MARQSRPDAPHAFAGEFVMHRLRDSLIRRHDPEPAIQGRRLDAELFSGFGNRHQLPEKFVARIGSLVAFLLFPQGPSAIFRGIRTVVVDAIKRASVRARAHIRKEVDEARQPSLTNRDSSSTIVRVLLAVHRIATALHFYPRRHRRGVRIAVPAVFVSRHLTGGVITPAALGRSRPNVMPENNPFSPAFAPAQRVSPRAADDCPFVVDRAYFCTSCHETTISHGRSSRNLRMCV